MLHLIVFAIIEVNANADQQVVEVSAIEGQQASASTIANQINQETCLLAVRSNVIKTYPSAKQIKAGVQAVKTNSAQRAQAVQAYKWWRAMHKKTFTHVEESMSELDKFIATQNDTADACSSKLLESKRSLDGLLKDLFSLNKEVESHEMILQTEIENLHFTMLSEKAVTVKYEAAVKDCTEKTLKAKEEISQYQRELAELDQIAKPSVRYAHATSVIKAPTSLIDAEPLTHDSCFQFLGFMQARQNKGVALSHLNVSEKLEQQKPCDTQREELQRVFTKTYLEIKGLRKDAEDRTSMRKCMEPAITIKVSSLVSLVAQKDLASERIESATLSLAGLDPVLDLVKKRTVKLYDHVHNVLMPACKEVFLRVSIKMTLNVDYQKLGADDKDKLKGKMQDIFAKEAGVPQDAVIVTITIMPGSVKVNAEIQAPDASSAESIEKSVSTDNISQKVAEAVNSIPAVKAAVVGELKVEGLEVKTKASPASEPLQRIRELIISLEHCPGRNDFKLQVPPEEENSSFSESVGLSHIAMGTPLNANAASTGRSRSHDHLPHSSLTSAYSMVHDTEHPAEIHRGRQHRVPLKEEKEGEEEDKPEETRYDTDMAKVFAGSQSDNSIGKRSRPLTPWGQA